MNKPTLFDLIEAITELEDNGEIFVFDKVDAVTLQIILKKATQIANGEF